MLNALPVVQRELLVRSRRGGTYWGRFALTLFAALFTANHFLNVGPSQAGRLAFEWLLGTTFTLACAAFALTADTLSKERREGTLGLLLLTRVRSRDVTLGKMVSAGIGAGYAGLALAPILMLSLLVGGVTPGEAIRSSLAVLTTLGLSLACGLAASAQETGGLTALRRAAKWVLGLILLPLCLQWWLSPAIGLQLGLLSPYHCLTYAQDAAYSRTPLAFWTSVTWLGVLTIALLAWSDFRLRRSPATREALPTQSKPVWRRWVGKRRVTRGAPLEKTGPVEWVVARQSGQRALLWTAAGLSIASHAAPRLINLLFLGRTGIASWMLLGSMMQGLSWVIYAVLAWAACRFFFDSRNSGELELLAVTPVGAQVTLTAHWAATKRLLRGPVLLMLAPHLIQIAGFLLAIGGISVGGPAAHFPYQLQYVLFALVNIGLLLLTLRALHWLGVLFGLCFRHVISAVGLSVIAVALPPWALVLLLNAVLPGPSPAIVRWAWPLSYVGTQGVWLWALAFWAKRRLRRLRWGELSEQSGLDVLRGVLRRIREWPSVPQAHEVRQGRGKLGG